jgi:hypothetical protein
MRNSPNASQGRSIEKFKEKQRYSAIKNPQKISTHSKFVYDKHSKKVAIELGKQTMKSLYEQLFIKSFRKHLHL